MPIRSRSHVIETLAETKLRSALGERWILRPKDKDYGIDFEAELLTDDGAAPGNVINIQSKATDEANGLKARMKVDRLRYLMSFEVPAIIVRYVVPTDTLYWIWAHEAVGDVRAGAATLTIQFAETNVWSSESLGELERTVHSMRVLRHAHRRTTFPLEVGSGGSLPLSRVIHRLRDALPFLTEQQPAVPVAVTVDRDTLTLSVERLGKMSSQVELSDVTA